jgi:hypothetical protein
VLQVGLLPLAVVLVGEGHNVGLVALLAWRAGTAAAAAAAKYFNCCPEVCAASQVPKVAVVDVHLA